MCEGAGRTYGERRRHVERAHDAAVLGEGDACAGQHQRVERVPLLAGRVGDFAGVVRARVLQPLPGDGGQTEPQRFGLRRPVVHVCVCVCVCVCVLRVLDL